jgi:dTDP-D-glucose 4,6-dehydratase
MQMDSILVTGGAGFIGSNFVLEWLRSGNGSLVNLDKLTYAGNPENLSSVAADPRYTFRCWRSIGHARLCTSLPRAMWIVPFWGRTPF